VYRKLEAAVREKLKRSLTEQDDAIIFEPHALETAVRNSLPAAAADVGKQRMLVHLKKVKPRKVERYDTVESVKKAAAKSMSRKRARVPGGSNRQQQRRNDDGNDDDDDDKGVEADDNDDNDDENSVFREVMSSAVSFIERQQSRALCHRKRVRRRLWEISCAQQRRRLAARNSLRRRSSTRRADTKRLVQVRFCIVLLLVCLLLS